MILVWNYQNIWWLFFMRFVLRAMLVLLCLTPLYPVSSTNKTHCYDIPYILSIVYCLIKKILQLALSINNSSQKVLSGKFIHVYHWRRHIRLPLYQIIWKNNIMVLSKCLCFVYILLVSIYKFYRVLQIHV
jgi:hypothetical protein